MGVAGLEARAIVGKIEKESAPVLTDAPRETASAPTDPQRSAQSVTHVTDPVALLRALGFHDAADALARQRMT